MQMEVEHFDQFAIPFYQPFPPNAIMYEGLGSMPGMSTYTGMKPGFISGDTYQFRALQNGFPYTNWQQFAVP